MLINDSFTVFLQYNPPVRSPFSPVLLAIFIIALVFLILFVQVGLLSIAFDKLGLSLGSALLLLFGSLFGSAINLPLFQISSENPESNHIPDIFRGLLRLPQTPFVGKTTIAVNIGGCIIPVSFSLHLLSQWSLTLNQFFTATLFVSLISFLISRPIRGIGIGMPILVGPISAAFISILMGDGQSAPLAYISGTLGVLIGADLLRLRDIKKMGVPIAAIGGAGTFDGIFITGIIAVLLA